jgi:hypothetical protein
MTGWKEKPGRPGGLFDTACKSVIVKTSDSKRKTRKGWKWRGSRQVGSQESGNEGHLQKQLSDKAKIKMYDRKEIC